MLPIRETAGMGVLKNNYRLETTYQNAGKSLTNMKTENKDVKISERQRMEAALRLNEERYALATEAGKVGVWDWNLRADEIYLDPNLKALLGYATHEIKDHIEEWAKHIHPDDLSKVKEKIKTHLLDEKTNYEFAHRLLHKDGSTRWFITRGYVMRDETGKPYRMVGANTDITDLKQVEQALLESQEQFQQIAANINEVFWMESLDTGRLLYVSPAYEKIWGRPCASLHEMPRAFPDAVHPEDGEPFKAHLAGQRKGENSEMEYRIVRPDGAIRWIRDRRFPIRNGEGRVYRCAGLAQDITERKQSQEIQEQLRQRNIRAAAIAAAEENERRRISRELHDGLGQILTGIKFNFATFERMISAKNREERQRFAEIKELLNSAIIEVRRISHNLTPRTLDDFGLVPALEFLCRQVAQHRGVKIEFAAHNLAERLSANLETGLFRIAQEALNNIAKHAEAATANLNIARQAATITLCIEDDGKGFRYDNNPHAEPQGNGMGMINMRERVEALNGVLTIESQPGRGTKIVIVLPLN
jgi:PAS domain S-box-containing protein